MTTVDDVVIAARRPQRADARRNYDALIAAGRAAFAENGSSASLEDIARRAGVGVGTLYRNFPTRDDLIEAVYLEEVASLAKSAEDAATMAPFEALETWLDRFVDYVGTKHALIDGLNRESDVFAQCRGIMYGAGEPLLARAQAAGEARADVSISDVVKLVSGVSGVMTDDADQKQRLVRLVVDSIRAR